MHRQITSMTYAAPDRQTKLTRIILLQHIQYFCTECAIAIGRNQMLLEWFKIARCEQQCKIRSKVNVFNGSFVEIMQRIPMNQWRGKRPSIRSTSSILMPNKHEIHLRKHILIAFDHIDDVAGQIFQTAIQID